MANFQEPPLPSGYDTANDSNVPGLKRLLGDTPVRSKPNSNAFTRHDMDQKVEKYLSRNVRTTDTKAFVEHVFPVDDDLIQNVLSDMRTQKLYNGGQWKGLSQKIKNEADVYEPLTTIADAIRKSALKHSPGNTDNVGKCSNWINYANRAPLAVGAANGQLKIRPDIIFASLSDKVKALLERISALDEEMAKAKGDDTKVADLKLKKRKQVNLVKVLWTHIHTVIEVKKESTVEAWKEASEQLCTYLQSMFMEQLDRRFVLGLVLGGTHLNVWLNDRSGLLGTNTSFDIHTNPEWFVRVFAGLAVLSPEQIGWDPDMRVYSGPGVFEVSYEHQFDPATVDETYLYTRRWRISMPAGKNDKDPSIKDGRIFFITIIALSNVGAGDMCGRATVVWVAVKESEMFNAILVLYVIKQGWRPEQPSEANSSSTAEARSEARLYDIAAEGEEPNPSWSGRIYSAEDVTIGGRIDSTNAIRHNLPFQDAWDKVAQMANAEKKPRKRTTTTDQEERERNIHVVTSQYESLAPGTVLWKQTTQFLPRVYTRLVMTTYGWPVKYFMHRTELARTIKDAITDHKALFFKGILHRDISPGNIIIVPSIATSTRTTDIGSIYNVQATQGRTIDLDHAKLSKVENVPFMRPLSDDDVWFVRHQHDGLQRYAKLPVTEEVVSLALQATNFGHMLHYIDIAVASVARWRKVNGWRKVNTQDNTITPADLGWFPQTKCLGSGVLSSLAKAPRTGTFPFMSHEALTTNVSLAITDPKPVFAHDAVHDMESVFWVLVFLCLTRGGPGGKLRDELLNEPEKHPRLHSIVYHLFDGPDNVVAHNKGTIALHPDHMDEYVFQEFHPYFKPLVPMLQRWWDVLILAFKYRAYEYRNIHDILIRVIDDALPSLEQADANEPVEATQVEVERRKKEISGLLGAFAGNKDGASIIEGHRLAGATSHLSWQSSPQRAKVEPSSIALNYQGMPVGRQKDLGGSPPPSPSPGPSSKRQKHNRSASSTKDSKSSSIGT